MNYSHEVLVEMFINGNLENFSKNIQGLDEDDRIEVVELCQTIYGEEMALKMCKYLIKKL